MKTGGFHFLLCVQNQVLNESRRQRNERTQRQIADMQPSGPTSYIADDSDDEDLLLPSESPQQQASIN